MFDHYAAQFAGGRFLTGPSGNPVLPLGPNNIIAAAWVKMDVTGGGQQKIIALTKSGGGGIAGEDVLGIFYDGASGFFKSYVSSGFAYSIGGTSPTVTVVAGRWYLVLVEFAGASQTMFITDDTGTQVGGSAGAGPYNTPGNEVLTIGALPNQLSPLFGSLDSVQYWNSTNTSSFLNYFVSPAPGEIWHGGRALNFRELPADAPPTSNPGNVLQLYLDFNDPTDAPSYRDRSINNFAVVPAGPGSITKVRGAGY